MTARMILTMSLSMLLAAAIKEAYATENAAYLPVKAMLTVLLLDLVEKR